MQCYIYIFLLKQLHIHIERVLPVAIEVYLGRSMDNSVVYEYRICIQYRHSMWDGGLTVDYTKYELQQCEKNNDVDNDNRMSLGEGS